MISVTVITKNEEANIERCLQSVQWADEIILVDAESTDNTIVIAKRLNAKVIVKKWEGFAIQKEFAVSQAQHDWIFLIDADEEVTEELRNEILETMHKQDALHGYEVPRKSFFLGKWIRYGGWYPGYQFRLFKKKKAEMNHRSVHEGFSVKGIIGQLKADINHYTYLSLHQYIEKMNDYSSLEVTNKVSLGKNAHWYNFVLNPLSTFLRMYLSQQGFKDGFHGFLLAYYSAVHSLVIFAKTWEYQTAQKENTELPPITAETLARIKHV